MDKITVYKRLLSYLKGYRLRLTVVLLFAALSTVFMVLAPYVMGLITTTLFSGIRTGHFDGSRIVSLLLVLGALYCIAQLFALLQGFGMARLTTNVMQNLRQDIHEKMQRLPLNYYDSHTHGDVLSVITNDVDIINNTISQSLTTIVTQVVTAIGILLMMLMISPVLTIIPVLMVPLSLLSAAGVMKASGKHFQTQQGLLGTLNGYIEENYNGHQVVQAFGYQERAKAHFAQLNEKLRESACKAETTSGAITPITAMVNDMGYVVCAAVGCIWAVAGKITIGNVQAMMEYTYKFEEPFSTLAGMAGSLAATGAAGERIFDLLDTEEESAEDASAQALQVKNGCVRFENVQFGYTKDAPLMKDISFTVEPGQKVAIVGPTGAGKTTLINLLMRFYEIDGGRILVDGVDCRALTRAELRQHFGMVLQDTWLFEGTIAQNIAFANDQLSREEIVAAAQSACAHDFIKTLPGGYDMILNEGAENISQGEKQLVTIARAIAADPEIMILDEATSNVDTHTEALLQKAMKRIMHGRTSFVIAHRLSTIRDADVILYMEEGDIKEMGSHQMLMKKNGRYAALYRSQFA